MLGDEENARLAGISQKAYLRSVSWTERSPNKPNPCKPQYSSKSRACLPPLSVSRRSVEEWPKAGSDDLGVWPQPTTPGSRSGPAEPFTGKLGLQIPKREFDFQKDKLAFFNKECSKIADHIYLGSDAIAKNREVLRQNGITHVLNCVGFVCPEYFKSELVYKTLWLQDRPTEDITSILYDVFDYFEDVREQGGRVFVHCCQGISRSASLVIAYLMWKEGRSFEDAFQYVKTARGVTNPNMGFACQLLQCQKRVHAVPASPNSALRMYRMAPHSPYDPLHLVPKLVNYPSLKALDSRGAFIVHIPSAIYVWSGNSCSSVMSNSARAAAHQVIKYEKALCPLITIREGEEPFGFWDALSLGELAKDNGDMTMGGEDALAAGNKTTVPYFRSGEGVGNKYVEAYGVDFEIFKKALAGGVVPPFPLSGSGSETCLPARETGWSRLRRKLAACSIKEFPSSIRPAEGVHESHGVSGQIPDSSLVCSTDLSCPILSKRVFSESTPDLPVDLENSCRTCLPARETGWSRLRRKLATFGIKELLSSSRLAAGAHEFHGGAGQIQDTSLVSSTEHSFPIMSKSVLPESTPNVSVDLENSCYLEGEKKSLDESFVPSPIPYDSHDSLSSCSNDSPKACSKSPSLSPSTSDHSSSVSLSPSSSSWSDSSNLSSQASSPLNLGLSYKFYPKKSPLFETDILQWQKSNPPKMSLPSTDNTPSLPLGEQRKDVLEGEFVDSRCQMNSRSNYEMRDVKCDALSPRGTNSVSDQRNPILYQWPSMDKVKINCSSFLDTRLVYIMFAPDFSSGNRKCGTLYIWIGRDAAYEEQLSPSISHLSTNKDGRWIVLGQSFLQQMLLPHDTPLEVIQEGSETHDFTVHLNRIKSH